MAEAKFVQFFNTIYHLSYYKVAGRFVDDSWTVYYQALKARYKLVQVFS